MLTSGRSYSRAELLERVGNLAQLGGTRHVVLNDGPSKGVAAIDVDTGAGLTFTVLPDRGLDIAQAAYRGTNLVFLTPNGEIHPAFYEPQGLGWLRTFTGGLLTTCGLTYLGAPGRDADEDLGLHGRYAATPARRVQDRSGWQGETYVIEITGTVEECVLFGDKLRLTRTIRTAIGSRALEIRDVVENTGYQRSPFTILYHINAGFPLLSADSELVLSAASTEPEDAISAAGMPDMTRSSAPVRGYAEQNFLHTMRPAGDGRACAAMLNRSLDGGLGLVVRFDTADLPYLNQWKMMGQGDYVVGIEPCNAPCANRAVLRERGLLPFLEPGEKRETSVEIGVLDGEAELAACEAQCRRTT